MTHFIVFSRIPASVLGVQIIKDSSYDATNPPKGISFISVDASLNYLNVMRDANNGAQIQFYYNGQVAPARVDVVIRVRYGGVWYNKAVQ